MLACTMMSHEYSNKMIEKLNSNNNKLYKQLLIFQN